MQLSQKIIVTHLRDYLMIVLGLFIYSFGFTAFILPQKVVIGGMAGLGSLIYYVTNIPVGISVFTINILLLIIAFKSVSRTFVIRTIFGTGVMSFFIYLLQPLFTDNPIVKGEPFMNIVIGSVLCGLGIGVVFIHNGSTGGDGYHRSDGQQTSQCVDWTDNALLRPADHFIVLFPTRKRRFEKIVYGFVVMFIVSNLCDMVINSSRRSVQFMIFRRSMKRSPMR